MALESVNQRAPQVATLLLLVVVGLANCYRAATQSITVDEAYAYEEHVNQPILSAFTTFDAGHHILHTYGCILFVRILGAGVVPLRMTSLIFGFVYLWAVWRLAVNLYPSSWLALLAAALLALNPYVFDFMSAARGYGMALAIFGWAIVWLFRFADEICTDGFAAPRTLRWMAVLATLAVGANLTFAFPVTVLLAVVAIVVYRRSGSIRSVVLNMAAPAAIAFCLFAAPLAAAKREDFYFGLPSWRDSLHSLYTASFDQEWPLFGYQPTVQAEVGRYLPYLLLFVGLGAMLAVGMGIRQPKQQSPYSLVLGISTATLAGSVLLVLSGHIFTGAVYPYARTCLYAIFLSTLVALLAERQLARERQPWRGIGYVSTAILVLAAGLYTLEFRTQWYGDWKFDAGTGSLMRSLSEVPRRSSGRPLRLGTSWAMQSTAEFYKMIYHLDWLAPITRDQPSCADDYALVQLLDRGIVDSLGFQVLKQDPVSGAILAERTSPMCPPKPAK
jgi:hypothetical protein